MAEKKYRVKFEDYYVRARKKVTLSILQLDNKGEVIEEWKGGVKNLVENANLDLQKRGINREKIDQALKKGFRSLGYYWIWKHQWDNGKRPNFEKQVRYRKIYAYKCLDDNCNQMEFLGRFNHAVEAAKELKLSATNIRYILVGTKDTPLKNHWFTKFARSEEEDIIADISDIEKAINKFSYNDKRVFKLQQELANKKQILEDIKDTKLGI